MTAFVTCPNGARMTRDFTGKIISVSFQPTVGGAAGGSIPNGLPFYDGPDTSRRLKQIRSWGFNCVKHNWSGLNSTSYSYPADSVFKGLISEWYARCRDAGLLITYLNNSYSSTVFGAAGSQGAVNIARLIQVMGWHMTYAAQAGVQICGVDLCNEMNSYANAPTTWQSATNNGVVFSAVSTQQYADMQSLALAYAKNFPGLPLTASVYVLGASSWTGDLVAFFQFQQQLGFDYHDYHPYEGQDQSTTITAGPPASHVAALEASPYFIGRHFAGECGCRLANSNAGLTAFMTALGGHAALAKSLGVNTFTDQNFDSTGLSAGQANDFGIAGSIAKQAGISTWPGLLPAYVGNGLGPAFITTIREYNTGSGDVAPSYPNDRIVASPWTAFSARNDTTSVHSNTIQATANFPLQTVFSSAYPAGGGTSAVCSTGFMDYGNYLDGSSNGITAATVNNITSLSLAFNFSYSGSVNSANIVADCFVFSDASGTTAKIVAEVEVYFSASAGARSFFAGNPVVGTYTSAAIGTTPSLTWTVTYQASNSQGKPYYQFSLPAGTTMLAGTFDFRAAFNWLKGQYVPGQTTNYCLTGAEYFTGYGVGYEALNSSISLTVNAVTPVYSHS